MKNLKGFLIKAMIIAICLIAIKNAFSVIIIPSLIIVILVIGLHALKKKVG